MNRLDTDGTPLTGDSDAVVIAGDCVQSIQDEDITTTDAQQEDGCVTIPERVRRTGARLTITLGSSVDVDFLTLIGEAEEITSGGQQVGWQDVVSGGTRCVCSSGSGSNVSVLAWYEAWQCDECVGVVVRGWPKVGLTRTGSRQQQRANVLATYQYQGQYTPNSNYGLGPGDALFPSDIDITGGSFEILMSDDDAVSIVNIVTPVVPAEGGGVSTDTCIACGDMPAGFLSGPYAVGGTLNGLDSSS